MSSGVLADGRLLRELHVVERPVGGDICDVRQVDGDRAALIDIANSEVELILGLVIAGHDLCQ